jgi:ATP-dependent DNA helicase RecG
MHESVSASALIGLLHLKDADALRAWLHPLLDMGLVVSSGSRSKAKEYRVNPEILKNSQYKGKTSLKRIENYRLKELILEDLKIYEEATMGDIQKRIGEEIATKRIWMQLQELISEGKVMKVGQNRWVRYQLAK